MHELLVNRSGGLNLPRKSMVRLTDRPDMTIDVYCGRKTTTQHQLTREKSDFLKSIIHSQIIFCFITFIPFIKGNMRLQEEPREDGANLGMYCTDSWSTAPLFLLDASSDGPSHTHSLPPCGSSSSGYEGNS